MNKENKYPLVSVITPCHNDGKHLNDSINSVLNSDYPNIEHVIIDDGSTDALTLSILDKFDKKQNIRVIKSVNQGVCKARQDAISLSNGKYILPLDADDIISKEYISKAVFEMEQNENIALVVTDYQFIGRRKSVIKLEEFSLERLLGHNLFVNTSLFRRIDFDSVDGYSQNMKSGLEDWDLWIKLLSTGGEVKQIEGINFHYRLKKRSNSRNAQLIINNVEKDLRKQIWENHKDLYTKIFPDPLETFEYLRVAQSKEYRIGKIILTPIRKLMDLFNL